VASCLTAGVVGAADSPQADDGDAFRGAAAVQYGKILATLAAKGKLDDDPALLARSRRIAAGLIAAASEARSDVAAWPWEVHVTTDASRGTFCIAGGKVLVGGQLVKDLELEDGELAMLLGHEIAHAAAGHRRAAVRGSMDTDAAEEVRAAEIALQQEDEADRLGMELAHRAGWPAAGLVSFFDKLAAREPAGTFNASHPTAAARAATARTRAQALGPGRANQRP
jgi:predicted Zn-dependent protease